jgi:hypothetical protein
MTDENAAHVDMKTRYQEHHGNVLVVPQDMVVYVEGGPIVGSRRIFWSG